MHYQNISLKCTRIILTLIQKYSTAITTFSMTRRTHILQLSKNISRFWTVNSYSTFASIKKAPYCSKSQYCPDSMHFIFYISASKSLPSPVSLCPTMPWCSCTTICCCKTHQDMQFRSHCIFPCISLSLVAPQ
jgi:hypothetical protein